MCDGGRAIEGQPRRKGAEFPYIDTDIELPRLLLQPAVTVAVQIDPALGHAAPRPKRVMAKHQRAAFDRDLGIWLKTFPAAGLRRRSAVVVAGDEMLAAGQPGQQVIDHRLALADREVAEVPYFVVGPDRLVPALDHCLVHRCNRSERPPIEAQSAAMPEMRVAGKEDSHRPA